MSRSFLMFTGDAEARAMPWPRHSLRFVVIWARATVRGTQHVLP
jgi:hypothetical protein